MSQAEKAPEKQKSRNLHQVAKIWSSEQKLTSPRTRLILLIATRLPFLSLAQRKAQEIPTCRVSPSTPVIFTHPTWAFRLQIHLLKEPCEKARSIRRGGKKILRAINQPRGAAAAAAVAPTSWFASCKPRAGGPGRGRERGEGPPGGSRTWEGAAAAGSCGARASGEPGPIISIKVCEPGSFKS